MGRRDVKSRDHRTDRYGSVLLEFVFAFPLMLALLFACMQIAHIWTARLVVYYAATAAARTILTAHESEYEDAAQQAAEQVLSWTVIGQAFGEIPKEVPGWGLIPGSGSIDRKTRVEVQAIDDWNYRVDVEFDFGLIMPIAGPMIAWAVNPWGQGTEWLEPRADPTGNAHRYLDTVAYPHVVLRESALVAKPFKTMYPTGVPAGGW